MKSSVTPRTTVLLWLPHRKRMGKLSVMIIPVAHSQSLLAGQRVLQVCQISSTCVIYFVSFQMFLRVQLKVALN